MHDDNAPGPVWLGRDPALLEARRRLALAAPSDRPVLVLGETGTGKELAARTVHTLSFRADGALVALNCGALPDGLVESELFGAARGAFTGATGARAGLVESAQGGTLFLDEIGDASPLLQMKLLRLLAEREYRRVGDARVRTSDARIVAATHRDLAREVGQGRFRADLWYRLAVLEVTLPPLRARGGDVHLLARVFLARERPGAAFDRAAHRRLAEYAWPGNVRELAHAVAQAALFGGAEGGTEIGEEALPERVRGTPRDGVPMGLAGELAELEARRIAQALEQARGNRARAARALGLSRQGLWKKLKRHDPGGGNGMYDREEAWPRRS